jgi:hypothetical protein
VKILSSILLFLIASTATAEVKLSKNGICHTPESRWYEQTKHYTPFDTLQACLDAGGRNVGQGGASKAQSSPVQHGNQQVPVYSRAAFGQGWADTDKDCQDSRAEALIQTSTIPAVMKGCRVLSGRWISPYSGHVIMNPKTIDIDHVVPLNWAWHHGASKWSAAERERFANDLVNLLPVEASLNRAKGAKGPNEWLPPSGQCQYVARFKRLVLMYKLHISKSEQQWFDQFLASCSRNQK